MTGQTEIDIRQSADRVIALLEQNRTREAMQLLERERQGERLVVQEALDRYVAAGAADRIAALRRAGATTGEEGTYASLDRVAAASRAPRFSTGGVPGEVNEMAGLTDAQQYDIFASIVATRGNQAAREALQGQDRVILGLRRENSTLASPSDRSVAIPALDDPRTREADESRTGVGVYNDRVVVLWRGADGSRHLRSFDRANTEPTAQYDHHAGSDGHRRFAQGGIDGQVRAAATGYRDVTRRKIEGVDVNGDGLRDLGRLAEGTIEMQATTHPAPHGQAADFALRPSPAALTPNARAGRVQRDTNGDGWFDEADINGVQDLDRSFKIHPGSSANTDSAGCQTILRGDYHNFETAVRGRPQQTRWQYVLTSTTPAAVHQRQAGDEVAPEQRPADRAPPRQQAPGPGARDVRGEQPRPGHADALFDAIRRQLPEGTSPEHAAHAFAQARINGIRGVDQLDRVAVVEGQAWVIGRTPGFFAKIDLGAAPPPLAESLQRAENVATQELQRNASRPEAAVSLAMRMNTQVS